MGIIMKWADLISENQKKKTTFVITYSMFRTLVTRIECQIGCINRTIVAGYWWTLSTNYWGKALLVSAKTRFNTNRTSARNLTDDFFFACSMATVFNATICFVFYFLSLYWLWIEQLTTLFLQRSFVLFALRSFVLVLELETRLSFINAIQQHVCVVIIVFLLFWSFDTIPLLHLHHQIVLKIPCARWNITWGWPNKSNEIMHPVQHLRVHTQQQSISRSTFISIIRFILYLLLLLSFSLKTIARQFNRFYGEK